MTKYLEALSPKNHKLHYMINYDGLTLCGKTLELDILWNEDKEDLKTLGLLENITCKVCKKKGKMLK